MRNANDLFLSTNLSYKITLTYMKHIPHVSQASTDTIEIYAQARAHLEREKISEDHPHFGILMTAFMRTFCESVNWRIAEGGEYDRRDVL
jgi:hypothetical protein